MFDSDSWQEIWITIIRNKRRSFFTAMGIFWGVFMLVIMSGAGLFFKRSFSNDVGSFATNSAFFTPNPTLLPHKGFASGRSWQFKNEDIEILQQQIEGIETISGVIFGDKASMTYMDKQGKYSVMGYQPQYNRIEPQTMLYGRYINQIDMIERRKVCSIGIEIAEELFGKGVNPLGKSVLIYNVYFTVTGVHSAYGLNMGGDSRRSVFVPFSTLGQILNRGNTFDMLALVSDKNGDIDQYEDKVRAVVMNLHNISPEDTKALTSFNLKEQFDIFQNLFNGIDILVWVVGIGTLFAGIVGVSNIMLVVVRERTQEIGVRRALGAPPSLIITQIMVESFILTAAAGVMGLTTAVGTLSIAEHFISTQTPTGTVVISPQISFAIGLIETLIIILGGILSGIIPAQRAVAIKPVDAIREQ